MKDFLKICAVVALASFVVSIPFLIYGGMAYVIIHFVKKFW